MAIEHDSLQYLTSGEFRNFLSLQKLPKKLKERKKFFLIEISHKGEKIFNKNEALSKINEIDINRKVGNVSEIKGQIAFRGIARGRVRVIRLVAEAKKIKEGDVLVASMTDPRYVPIMKKAAAIVTDEGGITCHAAIVARELKKPCIIGTKIATKVLKDGDLVEVDAEKGIVRILK